MYGFWELYLSNELLFHVPHFHITVQTASHVDSATFKILNASQIFLMLFAVARLDEYDIVMKT